MRGAIAIAVAASLGVATAVAAFALRAGNGVSESASSPRPVWSEVHWPFPVDQWGKGKAFQCSAQNCGVEVKLYLRAKLGSCDCTSGIANDDELARMSDFDLVGGKVVPLRAGEPITVAWMKGRSGTYTLSDRNSSGKTALSVVFNDRCDMVVATAVLPRQHLATIEPAVMTFLNTGTVLRWAEVTLGL